MRMIAPVTLCLALATVLPVAREASCQGIFGSVNVIGNDTLLLTVQDDGSKTSDESLQMFLRAVRGVKDLRFIIDLASDNATRGINHTSFSPGNGGHEARRTNEDNLAILIGKVVALTIGKKSNWLLDWMSGRGYSTADVQACGRLFSSITVWQDMLRFLLEYLTSLFQEKTDVGKDTVDVREDSQDNEEVEVMDKVSQVLRQAASLLRRQAETRRKNVERLRNNENLDLMLADVPKSRRRFFKSGAKRREVAEDLDLKDALSSDSKLDRLSQGLRSNDSSLYSRLARLIEHVLMELLRWIADKSDSIEEVSVRRSFSADDQTRRLLAMHDQAKDLRRMITKNDDSPAESLDVNTYDKVRAKVLAKILDGILQAFSTKEYGQENRVDEDEESIAKRNIGKDSSQEIDLKDEKKAGKNASKTNELRFTRRTLTRIGESMHDTNGNVKEDRTMIWKNHDNKFNPNAPSLRRSSNSAFDSNMSHRHQSGRKSLTRFDRSKNTSSAKTVLTNVRLADDDVWRSIPRNISQHIVRGNSGIHSTYNDDLWIIPNSSMVRDNAISGARDARLKGVSRDVESEIAGGALNVFSNNDVSGRGRTKVIGSSASKFVNKEKDDLQEEVPLAGGKDKASVMDELIAAVTGVLPKQKAAQETRRFLGRRLANSS